MEERRMVVVVEAASAIMHAKMKIGVVRVVDCGE